MICGVSGAPAHSTSCTSGGSSSAARSRYGRPFCRVMRPTKTTDGLDGSIPSSARSARILDGMPRLDVDAVVDHAHLGGVERRVAAQDVGAHALAHRDDRRRALVRGLLDPARHRVPAAELLGLPRPQRLEAVRGDDVRDAVQQRREVPGEVRVPGVAVHDVGAGDIRHDLEIRAEGLHRARSRPRARPARRTRSCPPRRASAPNARTCTSIDGSRAPSRAR